MHALAYVLKIGPRFSEGARLLWLRMTRERLTQESLRTELRLSKGVLSTWLHGTRLPDGPCRGQLFVRFGIPPQAWEEKPAKPFSIEDMGSNPNATEKQ